jgi:hypothetical protein
MLSPTLDTTASHQKEQYCTHSSCMHVESLTRFPDGMFDSRAKESPSSLSIATYI